MPKNENPSTLVAFLSAFCFPGLGFLYLGMPIPALIGSLFPFAVLLASSLTIQKYLFGFWSTLIFLLFWQLFLICATMVRLKRNEKRAHAWFNSGPFVIAIGLFLSFLVEPLFLPLYTNLARFRPFSIPSTSMEPSIRKGDRLVIDTAWYKHNPIKIGDLVAYENLGDNRVLYLKRIVALGGDTVEVREGQFLINGHPEAATNYSTTPARQIDFQDDPYHQYTMLPMVVPEGSAFCLGDNRGNSLDSRAQGPIPIDSIHGKVIYTWWSSKNSALPNR